MSRKKIISRVFGGLGNQLFGYAAARRLALANDAELVIDDVSGFVRDRAYMRRFQLDNFRISARKASPSERLEPLSRARRYLKRRVNLRRPFMQRSYILEERLDFDRRLLDFRVNGTVFLEGYWQSESYFKDFESTIRSDLEMYPPVDDLNQAMAAQIQGCLAVAVHVRFFDSPTSGSINNAHEDYYTNAVAQMEALAPGAHYFVFSDRPEIARSRIPFSSKRVTCVAHNRGDANAYADMWLMRLCQHFIIANSTFSWWSAWLSTSVGKMVIAPGFEMREGKMSWGFKGLLPTEWIKL